MEANTVLLVLIVVALVFASFQAIQIANISGAVTRIAATNKAETSSTGAIDMTGWTENEKMNYDMHGVIPSRVGGGSSSSGNNMVGSC